MDPKLRPSFPEIVKMIEEIMPQLEEEDQEKCADSEEGRETKPINLQKSAGEKGLAIKRCSPLRLPGDKVPPKSPRPRRNIWLSRSQSDFFTRRGSRKINVQDPYYTPCKGTSRKVNPFNARQDLKGGKIKFVDTPSKSVISLAFDLPSPDAVSYPVTSVSQVKQCCIGDFQESLPSERQYRSLPASPDLSTKECHSFGPFSLKLGKCDPMQLETDARQKVSSNSIYSELEIPPFKFKPQAQECESLEQFAMDCSASECPQDENETCAKNRKLLKLKTNESMVVLGQESLNCNNVTGSVGPNLGGASFSHWDSLVSGEEMEEQEMQRDLSKLAIPEPKSPFHVNTALKRDEVDPSDSVFPFEASDMEGHPSVVLTPCMTSNPCHLQSKCDI
ncbi:dual specificity testis-specific protein kinase 2-like [Rhincodon typus]|uniref:dual specificity testis-specific protein kinase 2-like n=1 Tax=Rhincodon typus TaxID=259920 RepID=UPI00202FE503|nr:dual specificity testis-specific protein kinase 2-like [Rhincodon typus]